MPLYEYICNDCGQPFEKMMRFSETNQIPVCPICSGSNTKKNYPYLAVQEMLSTLLLEVVAVATHPAVFVEVNRLFACVSGRKELKK